MSYTLTGKLVVAISSRALFDFEEENRIFESTDDSAYMKLQLERLGIAAHTGVAFPLVKKLLAFNQEGEQRVEVVILSRNDPVSGLRVFRSAQHHGLHLERGVFTRGRPPYHYLRSLHANLFLSANEDDVRATIDAGFPAARVYPESSKTAESHPNEIRIAFDGPFIPRVAAERSVEFYNAKTQAAVVQRAARKGRVAADGVIVNGRGFKCGILVN